MPSPSGTRVGPYRALDGRAPGSRRPRLPSEDGRHLRSQVHALAAPRTEGILRALPLPRPAAGRRRCFVVELLVRLGPFRAICAGIWTDAAIGFYPRQGRVAFLTSFYWAIATLTPIGYGDDLPTTAGAREFTVVVAASQLFLLGYLLTVVTRVVADEGERRLLGTHGTDMRGHVVLLGSTAVGRAALRERLVEKQRVGLVANAVEELTAGSSGADLRDHLVSDTTPISRQSLLDAESIVRKSADYLAVGRARPDASGKCQAVLNPPSSLTFQPRDAILVLGSDPNIERFERWFGVPQGR